MTDDTRLEVLGREGPGVLGSGFVVVAATGPGIFSLGVGRCDARDVVGVPGADNATELARVREGVRGRESPCSVGGTRVHPKSEVNAAVSES